MPDIAHCRVIEDEKMGFLEKLGQQLDCICYKVILQEQNGCEMSRVGWTAASGGGPVVPA